MQKVIQKPISILPSAVLKYKDHNHVHSGHFVSPQGHPTFALDKIPDESS